MGVDPGEPPGVYTTTFTNPPHQRTIIFQQKATIVPPPWRYISMLFFQQQIYNGFQVKPQVKKCIISRDSQIAIKFFYLL